MKEISYNKKKEIPSFDELGTTSVLFLSTDYTVGTIFINMIKITIIRSIMIKHKYFSVFLINITSFYFYIKGNST